MTRMKQFLKMEEWFIIYFRPKLFLLQASLQYTINEFVDNALKFHLKKIEFSMYDVT